MASRLSSLQVARRVTLGVMLAGLVILTILHQRTQGIPSIDALDPFGGLETLFKYLAGGELIKKIEPGNIVMLGGIVVLGAVLSRFFCGWFCAFGALQGIFGWVGRKLFRRRFAVPAKLDAALRWFKYLVLVAILYFTWKTGELVIRPHDPLAAFGHLPAGLGAVWAEFAIGLVLLAASMLLSMLYERAFCKYVCPLGAFNAILGRIPLFRIKRDESSCVSCSKCDGACPMNIDVSHPVTVGSPECISCMECVTACPTKRDTLRVTLAGKRLKVRTVVLIGFGIFAGAAIVGQASGMLRFAAPTLSAMAAEGKLTVLDIKGSSTYAMVADSFGIELERLYREAGVDPRAVPADSMIKDTGALAGMEGFETDAVRVAVARILGVPYETEHGGAIPVSAPPAGTTLGAGSPDGAAAIIVPADFELEGTMSLSSAAAALGTTAAEVAEKLGLPEDAPADVPLRDMKDVYGYSMSDLKARIKE